MQSYQVNVLLLATDADGEHIRSAVSVIANNYTHARITAHNVVGVKEAFKATLIEAANDPLLPAPAAQVCA